MNRGKSPRHNAPGCHLCGEHIDPPDHSFLIRISSVNAGLQETQSLHVNVKGTCCAACKGRLMRLKLIRWVGFAVLMTPVAGALYLTFLAEDGGRFAWLLGGALLVLLVISLIIYAMQRQLLNGFTHGPLIDQIKDSLPSLGALSWKQLGVFHDLPAREKILDPEELVPARGLKRPRL